MYIHLLKDRMFCRIADQFHSEFSYSREKRIHIHYSKTRRGGVVVLALRKKFLIPVAV